MITVAPLGVHHTLDTILAFVRPKDDPYGLTRVDEAEVFALEQTDAPASFRDGATRLTFSAAGELVGYVAFRDGDGDLAVDHEFRDTCLAWLARNADGPRSVWLRGVAPDAPALDGPEITTVRELAVCAQTLTVQQQDVPDDVTIRSFTPGDDDAAVLDVLARAYAGTADGNWDADALARRLAYPWFRADDLLLAVLADGTLAGIHWMKQRDSRTGEVYNLAVHPDCAGQGYGTVLLAAGMEQLRARGLTQMVLWVDATNTAALRVYRRAGFALHSRDWQLQLAR